MAYDRINDNTIHMHLSCECSKVLKTDLVQSLINEFLFFIAYTEFEAILSFSFCYSSSNLRVWDIPTSCIFAFRCRFLKEIKCYSVRTPDMLALTTSFYTTFHAESMENRNTFLKKIKNL